MGEWVEGVEREREREREREEEGGRGSRVNLHHNRRLHEQACLPTFIGFYRATHSPIFFYYDKARA